MAAMFRRKASTNEVTVVTVKRGRILNYPGAGVENQWHAPSCPAVLRFFSALNAQ
jgi:hypothetical protein